MLTVCGACVVTHRFTRSSHSDMNKQKILIVDHDPRVLSTLVRFLTDEPYDACTARNGTEGLEILRREKIDLAVAEMYMTGLDGITLLRWLKAEKIQTNVLITGSVVPMEITKKILETGAVSVLDKPIAKDKFLAEVKTCISLKEAKYSGSRVYEASHSLPNPFQYPLNTARMQASQEALEAFFLERYRNPDLKFEDLPRHFGFSSSHGYALIKKLFDKTFREKLREVRIAHAERLIRESSLYINEIANLCGFRASNRFCEDFKRIHGISPTQYRKKMLREETQAFSGV